jgi:hypothetical protein
MIHMRDRVLLRCVYQVLTAADGTELLKLIAEHTFDS